ncbi:MAG: flagellar protein FliO/FliZ [Clostridia bacterium]|nr:flagellar protein FliO/FliZ [Clostridia bacterium]
MDREFYLALLRLIIFLPLVLLLAYLVVRYGLGHRVSLLRGQGQLEVLERLPLGPKHGLAVVRVAGRYFLLGLGEGTPALLAEIPDYPASGIQESEVPVYELTGGGEEAGPGGKFRFWKKRGSC